MRYRWIASEGKMDVRRRNQCNKKEIRKTRTNTMWDVLKFSDHESWNVPENSLFVHCFVYFSKEKKCKFIAFVCLFVCFKTIRFRNGLTIFLFTLSIIYWHTRTHAIYIYIYIYNAEEYIYTYIYIYIYNGEEKNEIDKEK